MPAPPGIEIQLLHWNIVRDILRRHVDGLEMKSDDGHAVMQDPIRIWIRSSGALKALSLDVPDARGEAFSQSDLPLKVDIIDWAGGCGASWHENRLIFVTPSHQGLKVSNVKRGRRGSGPDEL